MGVLSFPSKKVKSIAAQRLDTFGEKPCGNVGFGKKKNLPTVLEAGTSKKVTS
jgi:hypothetical protein